MRTTRSSSPRRAAVRTRSSMRARELASSTSAMDDLRRPSLRLNAPWSCVGAGRCGGPQVEVAEDAYRRAMRVAEELGMRPLAGRCHLGLGELYRRTDKRQQAQEHLGTATMMYREMGMTYWLERADAALKTE